MLRSFGWRGADGVAHASRELTYYTVGKPHCHSSTPEIKPTAFCAEGGDHQPLEAKWSRTIVLQSRTLKEGARVPYPPISPPSSLSPGEFSIKSEKNWIMGWNFRRPPGGKAGFSRPENTTSFYFYLAPPSSSTAIIASRAFPWYVGCNYRPSEWPPSIAIIG